MNTMTQSVPATSAASSNQEQLFTRVRSVFDEASLVAGLQRLKQAESLRTAKNLRLVFVGDFKAGKTTLIEAILGDDVLFTDLLEATAVPTEITYGDVRRLTIFPAAASGERPEAATVIENPTREQIRIATSADTAEERAALANCCAFVRLELPIEILKGLTIIDTPGLDSTNDAVVASTLRHLPSADMAVLVKRQAMLTQSEERFLRSELLTQGVCKLMVVVNQFQKATPLSSAGREEVLANLRVKLATIGCGHLPATIVDAQAALMLAQGKPVEDAEEARELTEGFHSALGRFLSEHGGKARDARTLHRLLREIHLAQKQFAIETATSLQSKAELKRLEVEIEGQIKKHQPLIDAAVEELIFETSDIEHNLKRSICAGMDGTTPKILDELAKVGSLAELQRLVKTMPQSVQHRFEQLLVKESRQAQADLLKAAEKFNLKAGREVRAVLGTLDKQLQLQFEEPKVNLIIAELSYDAIPPWLVTLLDYLLCILLLPLPSVLDVLLRLLVTGGPLKKYTPSALFTSMLTGKLEKALTAAVVQLTTKTDTQITASFEEIRAQFNSQANSLLERELAPYRAALSQAKLAVKPARLAQLDGWWKALQDVKAEVEHQYRAVEVIPARFEPICR